MRRFASCSIICVFIIFPMLLAGCSKEEGPFAPASSSGLIGTWTGHMEGDTTVFTMICTSTNVTIMIGPTSASQVMSAGTYTTNATVEPNEMDVVITQYPLDPAYVGLTSLGIYRLYNNSLTLAANEPGNTVRPTSFTPSLTTPVFLFTRQ